MKRWGIAAVVVAALALGGCAGEAPTAAPEPTAASDVQSLDAALAWAAAVQSDDYTIYQAASAVDNQASSELGDKYAKSKARIDVLKVKLDSVKQGVSAEDLQTDLKHAADEVAALR